MGERIETELLDTDDLFGRLYEIEGKLEFVLANPKLDPLVRPMLLAAMTKISVAVAVLDPMRQETPPPPTA